MSYGSALRVEEWREQWECETEDFVVLRKNTPFGRHLHKSKEAVGGWKMVGDAPKHQASVRVRPQVQAIAGEVDGTQDEMIEMRRLADAWKQENMFVSSLSQKIMHPAYQKLIGFGEKALPFIVGELRNSGGYWFWALSSISREDPVPEEVRGNFPAMKQAWLDWAAERGL
jgi:hypothetical protein